MKFCVGSLLICLVILTSCKEEDKENLEEMAKRTSSPEAVLVETVRLEPGTFYHELISNGKVYAKQKVEVPVKTQGYYTELNAINGQSVRAGDVLGRVDDFNYQTNLTRARQRVEKAEIDFLDDLMRSRRTTDTTNLPKEVVKMSKSRSGLTEAEIALTEARHNLNNTKIVAPINGRIANMDADLHNRAGSVFCTIVYDDIMDVEFSVIESEYKFVHTGMPVGIIPFANDTVHIEGTITEINPIVLDNGMITVKASFPNNGTLIEGMNVKVLIRKPEVNRLVVPKEALVMRQGRDVIFIREDSLAIWRYVTIEFENSSFLSIEPSNQSSEGLDSGNLVIVKGNVNLAHKTVVKEDAK